jgi:alpha-beta hydrolase superfamily lysophospholipase
VLAGLPTEPTADAADGHPAGKPAPETDPWHAELDARTACPTHCGRLAGDILRRGALYEAVPVLGVDGAADPVSALAAAREKYAAAPRAELVSIVGGRHDVFNDITHRTVAAIVILFLERLRNDAGLAPIAVWESLRHPAGVTES